MILCALLNDLHETNCTEVQWHARQYGGTVARTAIWCMRMFAHTHTQCTCTHTHPAVLAEYMFCKKMRVTLFLAGLSLICVYH